MKKHFLLIFFHLILTYANSQTRQVSKILNDINNYKFEEARLKIKSLENEDPTAELFFAKYCYFYSKASSISEIDSANIYYQKSFSILSGYETKEKEKLCKSISFCEKTRDSLYFLLEYKTFSNYSKENSRLNISLFLFNYPENSFTNKAHKLIDSIDYNSIIYSSNIEFFENYILDHPYSEFNNKAKNRIHEIDYQNAIELNSIKSLENFCSKYPDSDKIPEVQTMIEEKYWAKVKDQKTLIEFNEFIRKFPNSQFSHLAKIKIHEIAWDEATLINTSNSYKNFINLYPNSDRINLAKQRYELLKDNILPYLTTNKKYKLYDIESNKFINNDEFEFISFLDSGKFIVANHKKFGVIDKNGKVIIPLTYNSIDVLNGYLSILLGSKMALFSMTGEKKLDFLYDYIDNNGDFIITSKSNQSDISLSFFEVYDKVLSKVLSGYFSGIKVINEDLFIVEKKGLYFLQNNKHEMLSIQFDNIIEPINNLCVVELKEKKGVISTSGKNIIPLIYSDIEQIKNKPYIIVTNFKNQEAILNNSGEIVLNFQNGNIDFINNDFFTITSLADNNFNIPIKFFNGSKKEFLENTNCTNVEVFLNGFARAFLNDKMGIIDSSGHWIVPPIYDINKNYEAIDEIPNLENYFIDEDNNYYSLLGFNQRRKVDDLKTDDSSLYNNGLASVKLDSTYGFVNKKGEIIIPLIYNSALNFFAGITQVKIHENGRLTSYIIDSVGRIKLKDFEIIEFIELTQEVLLKKNELYFLFNLLDNKITQLTKRPGFDNFECSAEYFLCNFKGFNVILLRNGIELMDFGIDFSTFDLKQNIMRINNDYYNGKYDEAIVSYKKLLQDYPQNFTILYMLSQCYQEKGSAYDSKFYLSKALEIEPESDELRSIRININVENRNWNEVIKDLNIILNSGQSDFIDYELYYTRGYAYQQLGNKSNALIDYNIVLKNSKNHISAYNNRGCIYMDQNNYNLALNDFNNAIKFASLNSDNEIGIYYTNKGNALYKLKRNTEACQQWHKAVSLGCNKANNALKNLCK
jgi:tetratricopeptide (TPR) repeat protein